MRPRRTAEGRRVGGRTATDYKIAIAYDGELTEDDYFQGWRAILAQGALAVLPFYVRSGGNPETAVEAALREGRSVGDVAEFWCVSDVDGASATAIANAQALAAGNNVKLCLSNRCFEVWLRLHFERSDGVLATEADAVQAISRHVPTFTARNKVVAFKELLPRTPFAIENGVWLANRGGYDPSTSMHALARKLWSNLPQVLRAK